MADLLARTPCTPNQVSVLSFLIALGSLWLFAVGQNIGAGVVAQLSSVADGVDGDLARIKGMSSRFGGFFDAVLDRYADVAVIGGLTYWASEFEAKATGLPVLLVGLMAIVGSLMVSYSRARAEATLGGNFSGLAGSLASRDMRILIVMVGAIAGQGIATLALLAVLTNVAVLWRIGVAKKALR